MVFRFIATWRRASVAAMDVMQRFMAYAGDFEKTLADDDWKRLEQYFAADAVYEVAAQAFGCSLRGPQSIFGGMKKSLDGFDRKFDGRDVEVTRGPEISGDEIRLGWKVVYHKQGVSDFVLRGQSMVRYRDGKIVYLSDGYDPGVGADLASWQRENAIVLDPSYT
jgi:SnoaL-like domain